MKFQLTLPGWLTHRITRNIIFWLLYTWWHFVSRDKMGERFFPMLFFITIVYGTPAYINTLWLIPEFLYRKKYVAYFILAIALLFGNATISIPASAWFNAMYPGVNFMGGKPLSIWMHISPCFWTILTLTFGKYMADAITQRNQVEELQKQKLESELESLKSQVNPHFLFNALNTIYGMARRTNLETADAVMQLSNILRYVLYDCNVNNIKLEKEIEHLKQYVDFAKLRTHNHDNIRIEINGEPNGHSIAPLLLLPFIENAMKHGMGKHSGNSWVDIKVNMNHNGLHFKCANSNYNKDKKITTEHGGIGLKNVQRRLQLLYPQRHSLDIIDNDKQYLVELNLQLS